MDIDIEIYLKRLRTFFETQKGEVERLLSTPGVDLDLLMEQIELMATENYKELEDPTLTKNQILIAVNLVQSKKLKKDTKQDIELEFLFEKETLPIQTIKGFDIYLN
tara:strand:+ start:8575 stop:8895 length:321 start_codon:yes stop_codon:yes gene_type:complete